MYVVMPYIAIYIARYVGYKLMGNQLTAIDFNKHRNREIATKAVGQPRYQKLHIHVYSVVINT